jgi:phage terminase large subunit GpA-like protein
MIQTPEDVAAEFERDLRSVFRPESRLGVVDWLSSREGILDIPYSPKRGRFSLVTTPWLREPLESCFDPLVQLVALMKPIQTGGSLVLESCVPYIASRAPAAAVVYAPTDSKAKLLAETRLRPLLENCASTARLLPPKKEFQWDSFPVDRAHFFIRGADNIKNLQSITTKYVLGTEIYLWKKGRLAEALKRTKAFEWAGKHILESQAGIVGDDWDSIFATTDRREWSFACPDCGRVQPWEMRNLKFADGAVTPEGFDFRLLESSTRLACCGCGSLFEDKPSTRALLNSRSEYVAQNMNASPRLRGFHYTSLVARPWGEIASEWGRARLALNAGDEEPMRIFKQKEEAVAWSPSSIDSATEIPAGNYKRGEDWPDEGGYNLRTRKVEPSYSEGSKDIVRLRFLSVDVQRNGFFALVRSWSEDGRSRLLDWTFLTTFDEVDEYRRKFGIISPFVFVDSGDQTDTVTRQASRFGWNATRGDRRNEFPWRVKTASGKIITKFRPYARPRVVESGKMSCRVYYFGNLPFKDILYRLRRSGRHTYPHDAGDEYSAQMTSERRVLDASGRPIWKVQSKRANHLFDCEVIQILPALAFGLIGKDAKPKPAGETPPVEEEDTGDETSE